MEPNKYIKKVISIIILIGLLLGLGYIIYNLGNYVSNLEKQVRERDLLIQKLTKSENLVKEYFDIKKDSITNETIYTLKESKREIVTIVNETNCHIFKIDGKQIDAEEVVSRYNIILQDYVNLVDKYNSKVDDCQRLTEKYNETVEYKSYSNALKAALDLIYKNYEIGYNINKEDDVYKIHISRSSKIDSALMLLPTYRDKLRYNEKNKEWTIRKW